MELSTLRQAKKNLDITAEKNGFYTTLGMGKLYIGFPSGQMLELSEGEIKFQAQEYFKKQASHQ